MILAEIISSGNMLRSEGVVFFKKYAFFTVFSARNMGQHFTPTPFCRFSKHSSISRKNDSHKKTAPKEAPFHISQKGKY